MSIVARVERDIRRALLACIVALAVALPALGQPGDEHWVATWATALVARPLPPAAPPRRRARRQRACYGRRGLRPARRCTAAPPSARDGEQPDATANRPRERRRRSCPRRAQQRLRHCAARDHRGRDRAARARCRSSRRRSARRDVRRPQDRVDFAGRRARQRRRRYVCRSAGGSRRRSLRAWRARHRTFARHDPQRRVADELRLRERQSRRRGEPPRREEMGAWFLLARIEVAAAPDTRVVVAFGDSITDGARSTANMNARWPDTLARRLRAAPRTESRGIERRHQRQSCSRRRRRLERARTLRQGRADANRRHARHRHGRHQRHRRRASEPKPERRRLDRRTSPTHCARPRARPQDLRRDADTVRRRGLLLARRRSEASSVERLDPHERRVRRRHRLRCSHARPGRPSKFAAFADSGDHLHPGDAGYKAMGEAVDLALFR